MDGWMEIDGWVDGNRWMDGWMDGYIWMFKYLNIFFRYLNCHI